MSDSFESAPAARVLIIDDEPHIRKLIDISLRSQGYLTLLASTGQEGLSLLAGKGADIVLLDLGLPDRDGQDILRTLRSWSRIPVIVLTVRSHESEKIALLDAGANDYVTKPFGTGELLARIRALLRDGTRPHALDPIYDDGILYIDLVRREVRLHQHRITLTRKEFALLALLVKHAGQLIPQTQLLKEIWGPTHDEDAHYLRILVRKLRQKLNEDASSPRYILTEAGVGLRFIQREPTNSLLT